MDLYLFFDPSVTFFKMVMSRHGGGSSSGSGSSPELSDVELCELIAAEVSRVLLDDMTNLFYIVKNRLIELMFEHMRTLRADLTVDQFGTCNLTI